MPPPRMFLLSCGQSLLKPAQNLFELCCEKLILALEGLVLFLD